MGDEEVELKWKGDDSDSGEWDRYGGRHSSESALSLRHPVARLHRHFIGIVTAAEEARSLSRHHTLVASFVVTATPPDHHLTTP